MHRKDRLTNKLNMTSRKVATNQQVKGQCFSCGLKWKVVVTWRLLPSQGGGAAGTSIKSSEVLQSLRQHHSPALRPHISWCGHCQSVWCHSSAGKPGRGNGVTYISGWRRGRVEERMSKVISSSSCSMRVRWSSSAADCHQEKGSEEEGEDKSWTTSWRDCLTGADDLLVFKTSNPPTVVNSCVQSSQGISRLL